jgi:DNA-binding response OmpR family regulator
MAQTILIVEDEQDVATYLAMVLKTNGFTPIVAASVEQGLDEVRQKRPDLICLDIMMPKESGISMYTRLKEDSNLRTIPVIIISGAGQDGAFDFRSYVPDTSIPEPDYYIEKPVTADQYINVINKILPADNGTSGMES